MARPVAHITTPRSTPEEEAKRLRISKRRQKELNAIAEEYFRQMQEEAAAAPTGKAFDQGKKRKNAAAAA